MCAARRKRFWRTCRYRAGGALSLVAYLLATLGLPLPARARKETAGVPFPCQDHPCGCRTAEQCWKNCCCFTPAERLAWAKAHHVTPPAYAEQPAAPGGWRTTPRRRQGKTSATTSCCARHGVSTKRKPNATKPCCSGTHTRPTQTTKTA